MLHRILKALVGRWQGSVVPIAKLGLGIVIPALIFAYGTSCIIGRHAYILDRAGRPAAVSGLPASAIGLAYAAAGLLLYVHICWEEHPYLAGVRDFARAFLLTVIAVCLAATLGLALL